MVVHTATRTRAHERCCCVCEDNGRGVAHVIDDKITCRPPANRLLLEQAGAVISLEWSCFSRS
eukprot:jgi/Botrbrau1/17946/Bobra.50_1s0041.1